MKFASDSATHSPSARTPSTIFAALGERQRHALVDHVLVPSASTAAA